MPNAASADCGAAASAAGFAASLQAEQDALGAFISLLQAEQEVLVRGDAERLAEFAPGKAAHIDLLTRLGEQRRRHLASQDLADSAQGMLAWMKRNLGFAAAVRTLWRELLARAETARQFNQSNGLLIDNWLQQNRLKLAVLQSAAAADGVYRPDGQLRPLRSARSLDQA